MNDRSRPLYAVLIDADNIPAKFAGPILKEITSLGEPALRRVYGDWSSGRLNNWSRTVRDLGLVAHQETANTVGKNASDIGLVIDAMDILHTGRFDGFVLVSSDSDFTALANRIREQGLDVIGIGEGKAPESLRNVCNRFILIENIVDEPAATERGDDGTPAAPPTKQEPINAVPLILKAMDKIDQDDEWYALGQLGQYITADNPDFDTRTYGKRKLSDLVQELKRFETRKIGNQLHVRRVD
ncbi:NYN domain-containing protein [Profundibacterium mesophilum]|uniref:NYN domain containing protein n=1 Tax=Profundibacterium mesophilum KAUST100406-0324 TaxID=1037889 RepID=A0A921TDN3_9RHOB|nr:NYN domain-containing protein [Profundibacterium mesophilum]KAF0676516.1 NYN domain containing protein [Profundibacterium mesophilum KAUST100406-0324]